MDKSARLRYNNSFTDEKYNAFLKDITGLYNHTPPFRIAESPVFIDKELGGKILDACDLITDVVKQPDFKEKTKGSLFPEYEVPNETEHSAFIQYDFGICEENGELVPKLIEAQGFPTLYFYQDMVAQKYQEYFDIDPGFSHLFGGLTSEEYTDLLRNVIVAGHNPKNVVLLEIEPEKQTTRIDFLCTSDRLGIKTLCVSDLKMDGRDVYYLDENGNKVPVYRIYNRVIFDELVGRKDLKREFHFTEPANVEWAGHPNWFFRISKYSLPLFNNKYVPRTYFLDQLDEIPSDLENFVLKPLYSFSGSGVIFDVYPEHFDSIENPGNFILQEKVKYSPVIEAPDGKVKCEIRMLMLWEDGAESPRIINNLARLSRGAMIGVKYNRDKTWVGGSVGFFEK